MWDIITAVNVSAIDLNSLVVLDALLREKSATRAAARLGVTQSAVSNALARLRRTFGDPLLVRHARGLTPTPRALALAPRLSALVAEAGALFDERPFDAKTSRREFTLACADYYGAVVAPPLTALLRSRAPHTRLRLAPLEELSRGDGLAGAIDVHVGRPPKVPGGCAARALFDERFVCLTRRDPRAPTTMGLREFAAAQHVRVQVLDRARDPIDEALAKRGATRDIALTVPHFSLLPWVVLHTGYVATLSERLARMYAERLPLSVRVPPLRMGAVPVRMFWHGRSEADPGARFFRDLVVEASR